jgi:putative transposase
MSYIRIWIHCVWTTKNRLPYLRDEIRDEVIYHIGDNAKLKGIYIDHIYGYLEHFHALVLMGGQQTISDVMQKKG